MLRTRWKPSVVGSHSSFAVIPAEPGAPLGQRAISGAWRSIAFGSWARASAQKATVQSNRVRMTELPHPHAAAAHGDVGHVPGARRGDADFHAGVGGRASAHALQKVLHMRQRAVLFRF